MQQPIAYFSTRPTIGTMIRLAIVLVVSYSIGFYGLFDKHLAQSTPQEAIWQSMIVLGMLGGLRAFFWEYAFVRQLLFRHKLAVWIADGSLIYLDKRHLSARLREIEDIALTIGKRNTRLIAIKRRGGGVQLIPTLNFSEPEETVIERLKVAVRAADRGTESPRREP